MTVAWHPVQTPTVLAWRSLGPGALLDLLAHSLPYNLRYTLAGEAVVLLGTVPVVHGLVERRDPWLRAAAAAGKPGASDGATPEDATDFADFMEPVRWAAGTNGWTELDGDGPTLRFAPPGQRDLPPLAVTPGAGGLRIERPLPLLPARDAAPVVRVAVAHAVLVLNGLAHARVLVRDPRALTVSVESHLPLAGLDEDEVACVLDEVAETAPRAAGVLECVRNPAVARAYATAHNLPQSASDREPTDVEKKEE